MLINSFLAKCRNKIIYKFVLWFLRQCHAEQFEAGRRLDLANIVCKPEITRETYVEILNRKFVELAIIQTLHPQRMHRFDYLAFRPQRGDKFVGKVLVQQDSHAGCSCF